MTTIAYRSSWMDGCLGFTLHKQSESYHDGETFAEAVTYLKTVVSRLFLEVHKARPRRNISSMATREVNGVDISDLKRWYDSSEIKKLNESQAGRRILDKIHDGKTPSG